MQQHFAQFEFPDVSLADNGLLAVGGDLSVDRLISAYSQGVFPWHNPGEPILWWSPDPRCVFLLDSFKPARSLLQSIKRFGYHCSFDVCFSDVVSHCAAPRADAVGTWIDEDMQQAYGALHQLGFAHSVETWQDGQLVGGLYGVAIGRMFFGESMFSSERDASKAALWHLVQHLVERDFMMIDGQVSSPHLLSLGAVEIPRADFIARLTEAVAVAKTPESWQKFNR